MVTLIRSDLDFILTQILQAEAGQPPVNPHLPFGLREVGGTNNSVVEGQSTFGAADEIFPRVTDPVFQDAQQGSSYSQTSGLVVDAEPRIISNLIADQSVSNPAAVEAAATANAALGAGYAANPLNQGGNGSLYINNVTPDAGLSAPFNTWMTLFGQFFDHGLDLVTKGASGTVFIPLQPDDPLYNPASPTNFMVLTRATNLPGSDGVLGTADDIHEGTNTITPFVDQSQTYASHPSHQVFLRDYARGIDGRWHTTGRLLEGHHLDGTEGGMATWADLKANALKLGIALTDANVGNVPLLATDTYGNFIPGAHGYAQVVVRHADGTTTLVEGNAAGLDLTHPDPSDPAATVVYTGHAFLDDIAHNAVPVFDAAGHLVADGDTVAGNAVPMDARGNNLVYDDELLNAHYVAGDGRVNENIGLTAVHEVFHNEHNRQVDAIKALIRDELANGDTSFAINWVLSGANLGDGIQENEWNGERLFQVAKFATEVQYQHLVFEEFARKIAPSIHPFGNVDIHLDPAITAEFAHAVYRFGHSMLDETLPRFELNPDGTNSGVAVDGTQIGLIEAFLNPLAYLKEGANAAGEIALGTTSQVGNEIDEFVTGALRNNLLGLPLDLAALNIARGRETGVPTLNLVRNQIYAQIHDTTLKPYESWYDFGQFLKHDASLINFVAAYGTHQSILDATTIADKRAAALALIEHGVLGTADFSQDAYDFMHSQGLYASDINNAAAMQSPWSTGSITGLDNVDLWIGGLAEKQSLFGGLLGSTFNFIFETQLESLQDGDRLYYLPRVEGTHLGSELEANTFAQMIMQNTGTKHLSANIFMTPEYVIEASAIDPNDPSTWPHNPETGKALLDVMPDGTIRFLGDDNFLGNTIVLGGTEGNDRLQAGHADDDTVWGDGGDDWIDGGDGNDVLFGGDGNDYISDTGGDDIIHGDAGDDTIYAGTGDDLVFGGDGNDYIHGGASTLGDEIQGGLGDDIIYGDEGDDTLIGNEGDDWLDGGEGGDTLIGDQGAPTGEVPLFAANDVLIGGPGGDRMQGFSGDDIMLGEGGFDRFEGRLGFDWGSFERETQGVDVDMTRRDFIATPPAGGDAIRDVWVDTEAVSGSRFDDFLTGTDAAIADPLNELSNVNLIFGLSDYFPDGPVAFSGGNVMFGGDGSDWIYGRGGNDIIDGDAYLHVELTYDGPGGQIIREIRYDTTPGDIDTAVYSDISANYSWAQTGPNQWTIVHNVAAGGVGGGGGGNAAVINDGTDTLYNIERLQFADGIFDLDPFNPTNHVPVGVVTIFGDTNPAVAGVDPRVGSPLTADFSTVFDGDGIVGPMHVQWQWLDPARAQWVNIAGATGTTFTPITFVEGQQLRAALSFVDGRGVTERMFSAATNAVTGAPGINTPPIVVQQQALVGLPDTSARQGGTVNLFLPLTTTFSDAQTPANQLLFSAALADGRALGAMGLAFALTTDATGAVTGGKITGTLPVDFSGPLDIRVTATDGGPGVPLSVTDTFRINVLHVNQAPTAEADAYATTEDQPLVVALPSDGVLANDRDPDGDPITATLIAGPTEGTLVLNPNGTFTYTPNANFAGTDSFIYRASDGIHISPSTTVSIDVAAVDDGAAPLELSGTALVGRTLTAILGEDPDGIFPFPAPVYHWLRDGTVIAGAGADSYVLTAADAGHIISVEVDYTDEQGFATVVTAALPDLVGLSLTGSNAANLLTGSIAHDVLNGLGGNDRLFGLGGDDILIGGAGNDFLDGGTGADTMTGGPGNDVYVVDNALDTVIELPGEGVDTVQTTLTSYTLGANVENLTYLGTADFLGIGNALNNILNGGSGSNTLFGLDGADTLNGLGGDDFLTAGNGNDVVNGGAGNDTIFATIGDGNDSYRGGAGLDTYDLSQTSADAIVNLSTSSATSAQTGRDVVVQIENVVGGSGNDIITGTAAANSLVGGAGNDTILGGGGADRLEGGAGDDFLDGGTGSDTFVFAPGFGHDTIRGFDANPLGGQDLLDLRAFHLTVADVVIQDLGNDTLITVGADTITLLGVSGVGQNVITGADFLF